MNTDWHKAPIDPTEVRALANRHGINLLAASIFSRRGITSPEEIRYFLSDELSGLHCPFLFNEMEDVVERILQAKDEGEKVKVFGDRDADGITSTVLLVEALRGLGIETDWSLPQGDAPYGLTLEAVDSFAAADGTLLITVDCGISNHEEVAHAASLGIDTIVIDHHNPQEILPPALAVIDPKISESGYPFRDLAGCGVAAKVVWALRFASTRYYGQPICLLNVRPGNESLIVEASLMVNLVEVDRVTETIVPGIVDIHETRLVSFLQGREIHVYDGEGQTRMLRQVFGSNTDIGVTDIASEVAKILPEIRGKSLLRLLEEGWGDVPDLDDEDAQEERRTGEIDVLLGLFTRYVTGSEEALNEGYRNCLDLVAIGTLADLMPLLNENRLLVKAGLTVLSSTRREGLRELLVKKGIFGKRISTTDVGWQVSPLINATGRLGVPDVAARLLLSEDHQEHVALVDEIVQLNNRRKKLGDEAWDGTLAEARESHEKNEGRLVVVGSENIHRGITGILASRFTKTFNAPAVVVALLKDKAVGSARSANQVNVKRMLDTMGELFIDYGGHDYAAGFSLSLDRYDRFIETLTRAGLDLDETGVSEVTEIDAELPDKYMTPGLRQVLELFEPFGEGNPPLKFLVKGAVISELSIMGKKEQSHVRMLISTGSSKWPAVFWNAADRVDRDFSKNDKVDVLFKLGINTYQNQETLQLVVLDISG